MKLLFPLLLILSSWSLLAQNVDYEARINRVYGSNCGNDPGFGTTEEHRWNGWLRDNVDLVESYTGCIQRNVNGATSMTGTFVTRNRYNTSATQLRTRIDAWEDDMGGNCTFDTGFNSDDCRANQSCFYGFFSPLEYQWTGRTETCGSGSYNLNTYLQYRYATIDLAAATEYTATTLSTGGNRPFWGSRGTWAAVGSDCATSGTIGNNQTSSFSTSVTCKRQVIFRWRVSSQANSDFLEVYVNGVRRNRISGTPGWATVTLNLDFGNNTVEWRYVKDGFGSTGDDRGFVDEIRFVDATNLNAGSITGNQTLCSGGNPANLASTASGESYSNTQNYQWQFSDNGSTWTNIGGATGLSYNPPSGLTQRRFYRRRLQDGCGFTGYSNTVTVTVNPLPNGNLTTVGAICAGNSANVTFLSTIGTAPFDIVYNGIVRNNINSGTNLSVSPVTTTTYTLSSVTDNNGCVRTTGLGAPATVTVNTNSTPPTIAPSGGKQCPNTSLTLTASGGVSGTGAAIEWFTGPNGTGSAVGSGSSITVAPTTTTTYYARRQGVCNTTGDDSEPVEIRDYIYAPVGATASLDYCTDNAGWHHFYNANDEIIFSVRGDLSGATINPIATIVNNGTYYQDAINVIGSCTNGYSPGEERFELPRSWNLNYVGTLNGSYDIRYYFPAAEKTTMETAAMNFISSNPTCNYSYKYATPNGFYWFKNLATTYTAPQFDQPTKLTGTTGAVNGRNYAEITGITSFSGGSGGIILSPDGSLPVELSSFKGWNNGATNTLQWTTESELNNNRFELERSADGQTFERIATIAGAGTTSETKSYLHEDAAPLMGINYYRLRQIDHDGTTDLSNLIAIEVTVEQGVQRFFPNPTTGQLVYQFNAERKETLTLVVHNVLGQLLDTWTHASHLGINNKVLDWSAYPSGTYHVSVYNAQGTLLHTQAIIKRMP